jgi:hypothetical protein
VEIQARVPLTVCLGPARGGRIFCALSARRAVRLLAHRPIIPEDPLRQAAVAALAPPAGFALAPAEGPEGPGAAEADALAALAALNVVAARVRSPRELAVVAARLARRAGVALDEDRVLAAALGGLVLVRPGPDGPEGDPLRLPRRLRLLWRDGSVAWLRGRPPPGTLWGPGEGLTVLACPTPAPGG